MNKSKILTGLWVKDSFVLIKDKALGDMIWENNWEITEIAKAFMISEEDAEKILVG